MPTSNTEGGWSFSLAEYVRHNDMPIYEASERVLRAFQDELMPADSFAEFLDVVGEWKDVRSLVWAASLLQFQGRFTWIILFRSFVLYLIIYI